jgi:hypothetical protein
MVMVPFRLNPVIASTVLASEYSLAIRFLPPVLASCFAVKKGGCEHFPPFAPALVPEPLGLYSVAEIQTTLRIRVAARTPGSSLPVSITV